MVLANFYIIDAIDKTAFFSRKTIDYLEKFHRGSMRSQYLGESRPRGFKSGFSL